MKAGCMELTAFDCGVLISNFPWPRPLDSDIWIGFENSQECNSKNTISFYPKFGYPLSYMLWLLKSP